jgi:hypothetical protein
LANNQNVQIKKENVEVKKEAKLNKLSAEEEARAEKVRDEGIEMMMQQKKQ